MYPEAVPIQVLLELDLILWVGPKNEGISMTLSVT